MVIDWEAPATAGKGISQYRVQVLSGVNQDHWEPLEERCGLDPLKTECMIDLMQLFAPPYDLVGGRVMKFRVAAKNAIGWGEFSGVNEVGMSMANKPNTVGGLRQVKKGTDFVELAWDEVSDLGSSGAILYEI